MNKSLFIIEINRITRSSKPTQAQGLCGLICCAICQHKKLLLRKKYKKTEGKR